MMTPSMLIVQDVAGGICLRSKDRTMSFQKDVFLDSLTKKSRHSGFMDRKIGVIG